MKGHVMTESDQSAHLQEEPEAPGEEGLDGGTANRPAGDPHSDDATGVDQGDLAQDDMNRLPPA